MQSTKPDALLTQWARRSHEQHTRVPSSHKQGGAHQQPPGASHSKLSTSPQRWNSAQHRPASRRYTSTTATTAALMPEETLATCSAACPARDDLSQRLPPKLPASPHTPRRMTPEAGTRDGRAELLFLRRVHSTAHHTPGAHSGRASSPTRTPRPCVALLSAPLQPARS